MPTTRRDVSILFDGSFEGFLCVLYAYFYDGVSPLIIQEDDNHQPTLDTEEYFCITDYDKAEKVHQAVNKKISPTAGHHLGNAFLADREDRYMTLFQYLLLGFKVGSRIDDSLQQDCVLRTHKLSRQVGREAHLLTGFSRFEETQGGIFYCPLEPNNYVLPILAEHFSDRMMNQSWIIHDKARGKAAVYNGMEYVIADVPRSAQVTHTENEARIQDLWLTFFDSVNIKERVNPKVQRNLIPYYFRKSMTEFKLRSGQ
ncbi:MAG: TIGR03915 family putative DNA repair protein [Defluviitaleaceae bacterium]|nr:TIGR03915 family putative DNA repair protein [Defluviitaleaceae bacterium]